jgi:hypothetical protein
MGKYINTIEHKLSLCVANVYPDSDLRKIIVAGWSKELESIIVVPHVYSIEWQGYIPVSMKLIICDYFVQSGKDTWVTLKDGEFVSAHSFHQFLDCRVDVHRERQIEILLGDD